MSKVYKCDVCNRITDKKYLSKVKYQTLIVNRHCFGEPRKYIPSTTKKKTKRFHICNRCLKNIEEYTKQLRITVGKSTL